jgi:hypothetical protein
MYCLQQQQQQQRSVWWQWQREHEGQQWGGGSDHVGYLLLLPLAGAYRQTARAASGKLHVHRITGTPVIERYPRTYDIEETQFINTRIRRRQA